MQSAHKDIRTWYKAHGRTSLPWRTTNDPYHIYISEIMLQQTQVKTVLERFYFPFLKAFPTLQALADAPREKVLKQWEGLGYYNRAANLHKAAQATAPTLPDTFDALLALPGIGKNTAHAILAFAHHAPVPVMEANLKRVLARVFALKTPTDADYWEKAEQLLDKKHPFDYNQAMMDIGATVCTKKSPSCDVCPLHTICTGKTSPESYPVAKAKKKTPVRQRNIVVWRDEQQRLFLEPREGKFLRGLYGFPQFEQDATITLHGKNVNTPLRTIGSITHTYSHFKLEGTVLLGEVENLGKWGKTWAQIKALPLSKADLKTLALL
jgi:A/G-specific adenine glycosylase